LVVSPIADNITTELVSQLIIISITLFMFSEFDNEVPPNFITFMFLQINIRCKCMLKRDLFYK
jgi:hypothetical protein